MGIRTTLALLVLVGALVGVLALLDEKPKEDGFVQVSLLGDNRLSGATRIRWRIGDRVPIEIRRQPSGDFEITEPIRDLAALSVLRSVGQQYDTANLMEIPRPNTPEERERLGLEPPRATFEVDFEDGTSERFALGGEGPLGKDLFVLRDDKLYTGSVALYSSIEHTIEDLRERLVFRTPFDAARAVVVDQLLEDGRRQELVLDRADGRWKLTSPIEARADAGAAQAFVQQLLGLRIDEFSPGAYRMPERDPDIRLQIRGGREDEKLDLWFDDQKNLVGLLAGRGVIFKSYNLRYLQLFESTLDQLRARVLVAVQDSVHRDLLALVVDAGEDQPRLRLVRASDNEPWRMAEPVDAPADPTAVNELVTAVNNLRALEFYDGGVEDPRYGLAGDVLRLGYQTVTDRQPQFLVLGADGKIGEFDVTYAARTDALNEVVAVPKGAVDQLRRPWVDYVDRQIVVVRQAPSRVVIARRDGGGHEFARDDQGDWRRDGGAVDDVVPDIVERLRDLRGKRALLRREARLGEPDVSIHIGRTSDAPGQDLAVVAVWERGELPLLVSGPGNPDVVFELSTLDSDALRRLWR